MNEGRQISELGITPERLKKLVEYIQDGRISNASGKIVFDELVSSSGSQSSPDIDAIIEEKSLLQVSDQAALEELAARVLAENEKSVLDYKNGKTNALGYLVGQCMKASGGKANPGAVKEIVLKRLGEL